MSHHDTIEPASGQELLPCPFCGCKDTPTVYWTMDDNAHVWCGCGARGPWGKESEAIAAWNRRQPDRLAQIETRLAAWFAAKYPEGVKEYDLWAKYNEESEEYLNAYGASSGWTSPNPSALVEAADVCIVLFNTAARFGHSLGDAILAKLAVIERRLTEPNYGRGAK